MLDHAETKVLIADTEFAALLKEALALAKVKPLIINYRDLECGVEGTRLGKIDYEEFLAPGDPDFAWRMPTDEWNAITLNYTSGTTGNPKGVVYHHRGAALMCYANALATGMSAASGLSVDAADVSLQWLVLSLVDLRRRRHPCLPSLGAGQADLRRHRRPQGDASLRRALRHGRLLNATEDDKRPFDHRVAFNHAAAPPPAAVLAKMDEAGFELTHLYGLTETYGPATHQRMARRMGRASARGAARQAHPPGRALRRARGPDRDGPRDHGGGRRPTARRSAKSCSAAIS